MQRALVIVNPIAGRASGPRFVAELERGLGRHGISTETVVTRKPGDARAAALRAAAHDVVVAVGGDGTVNEILNGLDVARPIAVYPVGTGNVLAKEVGSPRRLSRFCEMLGAGRVKELDLASVNGRLFVSMAGVGFDATVAAAMAARRKGGIRLSTYIVPLLRCFATYAFPPVEVRIDDAEPIRAEGFVLVSNVRTYGGPFVVTPQAVHDDGLFDVCVLPRGSRLRCLRAMFAFFIRCQRRLSGARYYRGRRVAVTSDERVDYQVDGDHAGCLPATFEILNRKQAVVVPPGTELPREPDR